jgi:hypothetical protein
MSVSQRDFEAIAAILAEEMDAQRNSDEGARAVFGIADALADYFASVNERFDRDRFLRAAVNQ